MGDRGGVAGWRAGRLLRTREADVEVGGGVGWGDANVPQFMGEKGGSRPAQNPLNTL